MRSAPPSTSSVATAFQRICLSRQSSQRFAADKEQIPEETMKHVLESTLLAPSGFNLQPWQIIMVQCPSMRQRLAEEAMLGGGNKGRVRDCSAVAVFCADLELEQRIHRIVQLQRQHNNAHSNTIGGDGYLASLPLLASVLHGSREGSVATSLKRALSDLVSNAAGASSPDIESVECWSYKNTALAAQTYMLAATSHDLATCAMEGYDSRKARKVLRIPDRYGLPLMVATGYSYSSEEDKQQQQQQRASPRLGVNEVVFGDSFGSPIEWDSKK